MKKKIGCLAAVLGLCLFMTTCYLFYVSPDSGYYRIKFGLARGAPFRMHGKVIDQYGNGIPMFEVRIIPLFSADTRTWDRGPVSPFRSVTNDKGEYSIDTGKILVPAVASSTKTEHATYDGQFVNIHNADWDIYYLDKKGHWMRDARVVSARPLPYDDTQPTIIHVGRSGPPQRMIRFAKKLEWDNSAIPDDLWMSLDVLKGELKAGRDEDGDVQIRIVGLPQYICRSSPNCPERRPPCFEFFALRGGVQPQKDSFGCEAPPAGYEPSVTTRAIEDDSQQGTRGDWKTDWTPKDLEFPSPLAPYFYFTSREGRVYGSISLKIDGGPWSQMPELTIEASCTANPRGQRNLNYGVGGGIYPLSPIPLPVTLPFKEDVPFVDARKIWAYADPNNENTLIVEGEKGAVEAGAGFSVLNRGLRGTQYNRVASDGSFRVTLAGKEGDPLSIEIGWPDGISPKTGKHVAEDEGVELAPRWRLAGEGKR
jgi:hypothetical protein